MTDNVEELKKHLAAYNERVSKKLRLASKLKFVNEQLKEMQEGLVDWLLENNKSGFSVDDGMAEIKLRKRTPKLTVNKKHGQKRLEDLFVKLTAESNTQIPPKLAQECVDAIWNNLEKPDAQTTYWLEKKEISTSRKRKRQEMEEEALMDAEGHLDHPQAHMRDLVKDSE